MTRVAAIDCGTNSIRLLVADAPGGAGGELTDLTRRMEVVRLGEGVDRTGRLSPEALARTGAALTDYVGEISRLGVDRIRMVATSASRDASNADEFTAMVVATLGVPPEVITGEEEARLSFTGAVRGLPESAAAPYLVVDIGGGSTEFVLGDRAGSAVRVDRATSVDVGCVRMTERWLRSDPPTAAEVAAAEADLTPTVDQALAAVAGRSAATLVGLAGSVTTVAGIALGLPGYDPTAIHHSEIGAEQVAAVTSDLLRLGRAERLAMPVMHPGRADVIGAGAMILRSVVQRGGFDRVVVSEHDILDGIAWSLV